MRNVFIQVLTDIAEDNDDIYIISGDAGFGVFENFCQIKPDRFINAGVAEANMIGHAAGLSMAGFNVFVYNIIPFLLYRCYEQVRNDICYQRLPVTMVGIGTGLTYAPGGMSHYSVEDLAICQTLPNLTVISPIDPVETQAGIEYAVTAETPVYIRIAKTGEPVFRTDGCPDILRPAVVKEGEGVAIMAYGSIFIEASRAVEELAKFGISPRLISIPTLQPFPKEFLPELLAGCHTVFTIEEHFRSGSLASRMSDYLVMFERPQKLIPLCLPDRFIHDINDQCGMRHKYGIDAMAIVKVIKSAVQKNGGIHAV